MAFSMKAIRVNAELTQEQLAAKLGVSRQSVIDYENGNREVPTVYLLAFSAITGVSVDNISLPERTTKSSPQTTADDSQ